MNANTRKIVFVALCFQIEWLFYNAFWCETVPRKWCRLHRARGHMSPLLQMTGHGGTESRITKNKKVTKLYWPLQKHSPKRLIVRVEPKTSIIFYIKISMGLLLEYASRLDGRCPYISVLTFTFTNFLWTSVHPIASCLVTAWGLGRARP